MGTLIKNSHFKINNFDSSAIRFSRGQAAMLLEKCPRTCHKPIDFELVTLRVKAPRLKSNWEVQDDPSFRDKFKHRCSNWQNFNCNSAMKDFK